MNKRLTAKKETISLIQKRIEDEIQKQQEKKDKTWEEKHQTLLKQYRLLEKVFSFHKSIIQNMSSGLITIDLSGEITFLNHVAAKSLGYEQDELLGKNIRQLFPTSEGGETFLNLVTIEGKKYEGKEFEFLTKGGKPIVVGITTAHLHDESNAHNGIVMMFRDLTEIQLMRKQMQRMDRLATLGELSAGIAHEIRNPLAGIKASAQVLEEGFEPDDPRTQLISRIVREIDRANALLKEFFKFAKPSKPHFAYHDIEMIIDGVYLLLAPQMKKHNIVFKEDFTAVVPQVYIDENQIEQVIMNLFMNAIQAMHDGGELVVKTRIVIIGADKSPTGEPLQMVAVDIIDTGQGIPSDNLEKIFNPFFTTKPDGVGLGLSISSRLVEENRGKLDVQSQIGNGTTFTIILPTR
jgi:PAS domain S-box-containing protein